jgi:(S)-ureidoglycine-glyoxylate aminotransferase
VTDPQADIDPALLVPFVPPDRLLMGPGPINADPRVHAALAAPLIGQFDPAMTAAMNQVMGLYRHVFRTTNEATFLVDGTARAGIEAVLVSLLHPGDRVLVPVFGRFGHLLVEIARRCRAEVHTVEAPWGEVVPADALAEAVERVRPVLVATVQGDTSTTMCQPLAELGAICAANGALLYADVTASLGGNPFEFDTWGLDAASAGLQKCLAGPSGSAPVTLSPRAVERITARKQVEAGIRDTRDDAEDHTVDPIASNYFDIAMLLDYWGPRRLNHHTEATSMLYAALECARILVDEGVDRAVERHRVHGEAMLAGVQGLGLEVFGDPAHKMHNVVGVEIPAGVDGDAVRAELLGRHGIEIGTSFGPLAGRIWRIGTMGYNARRDAVDRTLAALETVLADHGFLVAPSGGVAAADEIYQRAATAAPAT